MKKATPAQRAKAIQLFIKAAVNRYDKTIHMAAQSAQLQMMLLIREQPSIKHHTSTMRLNEKKVMVMEIPPYLLAGNKVLAHAL